MDVLVQMRTQIGGTRNGAPWPARGDVIDLPDHEAADMIAAGYAVEAPNAGPTNGQDAPPADEADAATTAGDAPAVPEPRRKRR